MKKGGVKTLFEGVFEAISDFSNEYEKYGAELIYFKREMISALRKKSLEKKVHADGYSGAMEAYQLFHQVYFQS